MHRVILLGRSRPSWVTSYNGSPAKFDYDWANDRAWKNNALTDIAAAHVFDRESAATRIDSSGDLQSVASDVIRRDYRYSPGGVLVEDGVGNVVPTPNFAGGVAHTYSSGSSQTTDLPANMRLDIVSGLTVETTYGTEDGRPGIYLHVTGTPGSSPHLQFFWHTVPTAIAGLNGEVWTVSSEMRLAAGTKTGLAQFTHRMFMFNSGGSFIANVSGTNHIDALTGALSRFASPVTLNQATSATVIPVLAVSGSGTPVDYTLFVALPQSEKRGQASSAILSSPRADESLTADVTGMGLRTLAADFRLLGYPDGSSEAVVAQVDDGTSDNRAALVYVVSTGHLRGRVYVGGAEQCDLDLGTYVIGSRRQAALSWEEDAFSGCLDGQSPATDSDGDDLTGLTTLRYGSDVSLADQGAILANRMTGFDVAVPADALV